MPLLSEDVSVRYSVTVKRKLILKSSSEKEDHRNDKSNHVVRGLLELTCGRNLENFGDVN